MGYCISTRLRDEFLSLKAVPSGDLVLLSRIVGAVPYSTVLLSCKSQRTKYVGQENAEGFDNQPLGNCALAFPMSNQEYSLFKKWYTESYGPYAVWQRERVPNLCVLFRISLSRFPHVNSLRKMRRRELALPLCSCSFICSIFCTFSVSIEHARHVKPMTRVNLE